MFFTNLEYKVFYFVEKTLTFFMIFDNIKYIFSHSFLIIKKYTKNMKKLI